MATENRMANRLSHHGITDRREGISAIPSMICMEADKGLSRLHRHEMEMMLALNSLEQATGRKMAGEVIFSHTGRDGVRHGRMAF